MEGLAALDIVHLIRYTPDESCEASIFPMDSAVLTALMLAPAAHGRYRLAGQVPGTRLRPDRHVGRIIEAVTRAGVGEVGLPGTASAPVSPSVGGLDS